MTYNEKYNYGKLLLDFDDQLKLQIAYKTKKIFFISCFVSFESDMEWLHLIQHPVPGHISDSGQDQACTKLY